MPFLNMPGSSFFIFKERPDYAQIAGNDIVAVQRCCTQPQFDFIRIMRQLELKVIYDLDDHIWDIPEYNPAYAVLSQFRNGFNSCISVVDAVTVSTKELAKAVRKHVKPLKNLETGKEIPIIVCENRLDEKWFIPPVKKEQFIVGWAGSSSHIGDLDLVEDALIACSEEHPEVAIEFRGCAPKADSKIHKLPTYTQKLWSPVAEFGARMPLWGWSIALAPVTSHDFNNSKSNIKILEAAYCKIPCLASYCRPYADFCSLDPELKWLLCAGPSAWTTKLRELINDKARCDDLWQRMYNVMQEHFSFRQPHEGWEQAAKIVREL
jgi:hypothetical protein